MFMFYFYKAIGHKGLKKMFIFNNDQLSKELKLNVFKKLLK